MVKHANQYAKKESAAKVMPNFTCVKHDELDSILESSRQSVFKAVPWEDQEKCPAGGIGCNLPITNASLWLLKKMCSRKSYQKAYVMLSELDPEGKQQIGLMPFHANIG